MGHNEKGIKQHSNGRGEELLKTWTWSPAVAVREATGDVNGALADAHLSFEPLIFRGLAREWPLVAAARDGSRSAAGYIARFDQGMAAKTMLAPPEVQGRFFYADDMRGYNFAVDNVAFEPLFRQLVDMEGKGDQPAIYAGSNPVDQFLPGFSEENPMPLDIPPASTRIWIGNASHVAPHFDVSYNIAVAALGRRRFTLFPPDQTANLYVGPLDVTIAGQPVSMVDIRQPDLDRFPRFAKAMESAIFAELEPGDALYIPTLWWHCVEALDPVNILVNYWYGAPAYSSPFAALIHAMLAVRDLPGAERDAWRGWFNDYVFDDNASAVAEHLPPHAKGVAGPPSTGRAQAIRAFILRAFQAK